MSHVLNHPTGKFTVTVATDNRRDVLLSRGYTLVTSDPPKSKPKAATAK